MSQGFDQFFMARPAKVLRKEPAMEVELKLDFNTYSIMTNPDRLVYIKSSFYEAITAAFALKSIKGFDKECFLNDLKDCLFEQELT